MPFLVYSHPNFSDSAIALVNDIIQRGHGAQHINRLPHVHDIREGINVPNQRVLIIGAYEVENNKVIERSIDRQGPMLHDREEFLVSIAAPVEQ